MGKSNNESRAVKKVLEDMQSMLNALQTHYTPTSTLPMEGHDVLVSDVSGELSSSCGLQAKVDAARTAWTKAIVDRDAILPKAKSYLTTVRAAVLAQKGADSSDLLAFGIVVRKPASSMTTADKMVAIAKRSATRKARGTLGKRQREQITTTGHAGVSVVAPDGSSIPVVPHTAPVGVGAQQAQPPNGSESANATPHAVTASNGSSSTGNGSR